VSVFKNVTLARKSVAVGAILNVLMQKFYVSALVGVLIK